MSTNRLASSVVPDGAPAFIWDHLATKADLAVLETRLTWRMVGIMVGLLAAQGALIVGLIVGLLQPLPQ